MKLSTTETVIEAYTCRICKHGEMELSRVGVRHNPERQVMRCKGCGTEFLWPIPDQDMRQYYDAQYRLKHNNDVDKTRTSEDRFNDRHYDLQDALETVLPLVTPESRVLEIGCAAGAFLSQLQPHVAEVVGVDYNSEDAKYASEKLGITTYQDDIWETDAKHAYFDLIVSFHVIEHVQDPVRWLYKIRPYLRPNGTAVISTPNLDHPYFTLFDVPDSFGDFWYREPHIWYFNQDSLTETARQAGYSGETHVSQIYNVSNLFHWQLTGGPQPNADVSQTQQPILIRDGSKAAFLLNETYIEFQKAYRDALMKNSYGDVLYYIGGRFENR